MNSEFDRELLANAFPSNWSNPTPAGRYHLVVLGGGTAGLVCAAGAAGLGAKVALIEKHRLGGDCLNTGCVPSKALLRSARAAAAARRSEEFGVRHGPVEVDWNLIQTRMRRLRAHISHHDSAQRFKSLGIDVYLGEGQFTSPSTIDVDGRSLSFSRAVIATGARPALPDTTDFGSQPILTSDTIWELPELPRRLIVLGGGPIGCELGQAFRRFGCDVEIVQRAAVLLPREEPAVSERLAQRFREEGIQLHLNAKTPPSPREGDIILASIGRRPNVEGLNLESAKVAFTSAGVVVNDFLRTTNPRIYAAGDVCSDYKFTHAADAMARIVIQNALFFGWRRASRLIVPWTTFTDPEIGHVGLTARQAAEKNIAIQTFRIDLKDVDRAVLDGETDGFAVANVRRGSDRIVGATIVASHAGDILSELTLAMTCGRGLSDLSRTIHAYPTQGDVLRKLGDAYQRSRLTPTIQRLLGWLLRWHS
jgi:pyruvate/2-oxoglutarate dehydrogenase complex dihydrolipoamide dehydrogenase (E3) component